MTDIRHLKTMVQEQKYTIEALRHTVGAYKTTIDDLNYKVEDLGKRNKILSQLAHESSVKMCGMSEHIAELQETIEAMAISNKDLPDTQ